MSSPAKISTRDRLVQAATHAFAQSGLDGATTREIARLAGVNEVTLFRHFQSKEKLLAAVVENTFRKESDSAAEPPQPPAGPADAAATSLRSFLRAHAEIYHKLLSDHFPLIRALIGELHRHQEHEQQVIKALFVRRRQDLLRELESAVGRGLIRGEVNLEILADQFCGLIFFHVLKRTSPTKLSYSSAQYMEASIELLAAGIEPAAPLRPKDGRSSKARK